MITKNNYNIGDEVFYIDEDCQVESGFIWQIKAVQVFQSKPTVVLYTLTNSPVIAGERKQFSEKALFPSKEHIIDHFNKSIQ